VSSTADDAEANVSSAYAFSWISSLTSLGCSGVAVLFVDLIDEAADDLMDCGDE
jgi:hypothetical protein